MHFIVWFSEFHKCSRLCNHYHSGNKDNSLASYFWDSSMLHEPVVCYFIVGWYLWMNFLQVVFLPLHWWTSGFFPVFDYSSSSWDEHVSARLFVDICFHFYWINISIWDYWVYDKYMFNFRRNRQVSFFPKWLKEFTSH